MLALAEPRLDHGLAAHDRLVVRVIAVLDVLREQRHDRVRVVGLPRLDVVVQPASDVLSFHLLLLFTAVPGEAVCPMPSAAARPRTRSAWAPCIRRATPRSGAERASSVAAPSRRTTTASTASCHSGSARPTAGGVGDIGVAEEDLLDLGGQHVLAPGDDHVPQPVLDVEEALVVDPPEVAGVKPAVLVSAARRHDGALDAGSRRRGSAGGSSGAGAPRSRAFAARPVARAS